MGQRLYTAAAHGLYGATAPETFETAHERAEARSRVFGRSEIVVVERGNRWWSHSGPDRRYKERPPAPSTEDTVIRLVATVYPGGTMQMSLRLRVRLHPAEPSPARSNHPSPAAEHDAQIRLFP